MKIFLFVLITMVSSVAAAFDHTHTLLSEVLKQHLVTEGAQTLVDYQSLKQAPAPLDKYLNELGAVSEHDYKNFSQDQKLVFLINAYNAYTLKFMRDNWPTKSIKDLGSFFTSPWKKEFFDLLGKKRSLDWIEHETIRKNFKEPRIHFAVNCASLGCPPLRAEAFVADKLGQQLEEQARIFLNDQRENRIENGIVKLSKIFDWYGSDFASNNQDMIKKLNQWRNEKFPLNAKIDFLEYGWDANVVGAKE